MKQIRRLLAANDVFVACRTSATAISVKHQWHRHGRWLAGEDAWSAVIDVAAGETAERLGPVATAARQALAIGARAGSTAARWLGRAAVRRRVELLAIATRVVWWVALVAWVRTAVVLLGPPARDGAVGNDLAALATAHGHKPDFDAATGSCADFYCHLGKTASWAPSAGGDCTVCHDTPPPWHARFAAPGVVMLTWTDDQDAPRTSWW